MTVHVVDVEFPDESGYVRIALMERTHKARGRGVSPILPRRLIALERSSSPVAVSIVEFRRTGRGAMCV